jgi:hypothetical protein
VAVVELDAADEAPEDEAIDVVSEDVLSAELVAVSVVEVVVERVVVGMVLDIVVEGFEVVLEEEVAVVEDDVDDVGGPVGMTRMLPDATFVT